MFPHVLQHHDDGVVVGTRSPHRIALAQRRTDISRQRNDDVGLLDQRPHHAFDAHVTAHHAEIRIVAHMRQTVLVVHEVIDNRDLVAPCE